MPNGKGFLDCRYCVYAYPLDGWPILFGSRLNYLYHQKELPQATEPGGHRLCIHFQASETYYAESPLTGLFSPPSRQFARFGVELEPGVLYEYPYPMPQHIRKLCVLRVPDYRNVRWTDAG